MAEAQVITKIRYLTVIAPSHITNAQRVAGVVQTWTVPLKNPSAITSSNVQAWLGASVKYYEISNDGVSWSSPKGGQDNPPASPVAYADVPANGDITLHFRRTIPAGVVSEPDLEVEYYVAFDNLAG